MRHMDMPSMSCVGCYAEILWNTHTKADEHHAKLKIILSMIQNDLFCGFIDKATASFCYRLQSCVAVTGGKW